MLKQKYNSYGFHLESFAPSLLQNSLALHLTRHSCAQLHWGKANWLEPNSHGLASLPATARKALLFHLVFLLLLFSSPKEQMLIEQCTLAPAPPLPVISLHAWHRLPNKAIVKISFLSLQCWERPPGRGAQPWTAQCCEGIRAAPPSRGQRHWQESGSNIAEMDYADTTKPTKRKNSQMPKDLNSKNRDKSCIWLL